MSAIAFVLAKMEKNISGSDLNENENTKRLKSFDVNINIGHDEKNISESIDCVVITSAVKEDNPELKKAKALGVPILKRAQMLALISNDKNSVSVAGSHGKTTTSCYLSEMLIKLNENPSFIVGGVLKNTKSNSNYGKNHFVIEADESDSSFHYLNSEYSIITNIDDDHVDFYGSFEKLKNAFKKYATENSKILILNFDDQNVKELIKETSEYISFGQSKDCDYKFKIIKMQFGQTEFSLTFKNENHTLKTNITGDYNISNLVAGIVYLIEKDINLIRIEKIIDSIDGIKRRYDLLYKDESRIIIDDYAHHPTEIDKLINAVKSDYPGYQLRVFFEPHRYTRTRNFWNEFCDCFGASDELNLFPIYAASELPIKDINSKKLFKEIKVENKKYISSLVEIKPIVESINKSKEVLLCLGAGPISASFRNYLGVEGV